MGGTGFKTPTLSDHARSTTADQLPNVSLAARKSHLRLSPWGRRHSAQVNTCHDRLG